MDYNKNTHFWKLLLGKAMIYDFDPAGNYRELKVKKILKKSLKIKTKLREPALTALYKFYNY